MIPIRHRFTGTILMTVDAETLTGADLTDANLTRADLTDADLTGAYLTDAKLTYADLTDANLTRADLTDANLTRAKLTDAKLTDAKLTGANLTRAKLTGATMPNGQMYEQFVNDTVPKLLTHNGKTVAEVIETGCWDCHEWSNCPMHEALGIESYNEAPEEIREDVKLFVVLFDGEVIPKPNV